MAISVDEATRAEIQAELCPISNQTRRQRFWQVTTEHVVQPVPNPLALPLWRHSRRELFTERSAIDPPSRLEQAAHEEV